MYKQTQRIVYYLKILNYVAPHQHGSSKHGGGQPNEGGEGCDILAPVRKLLPAFAATLVFSIPPGLSNVVGRTTYATTYSKYTP